MKVTILRSLALACLAAAGLDSWSGGVEELASRWLHERYAPARAVPSWTDLRARPDAPGLAARGAGPRSWNPDERSPWANAFGTPEEPQPPAASPPARARGPVRLCSCYLPADARARDGGPLTDADIARLCRAQCF